MKVQAGKLYRMVSHSASRPWLEMHGTIWLAVTDEQFDDTTSAQKPGWYATFKSVSSGCEFQLSRQAPWSIELEEADGGDT